MENSIAADLLYFFVIIIWGKTLHAKAKKPFYIYSELEAFVGKSKSSKQKVNVFLTIEGGYLFRLNNYGNSKNNNFSLLGVLKLAYKVSIA